MRGSRPTSRRGDGRASSWCRSRKPRRTRRSPRSPWRRPSSRRRPRSPRPRPRPTRTQPSSRCRPTTTWRLVSRPTSMSRRPGQRPTGLRSRSRTSPSVVEAGAGPQPRWTSSPSRQLGISRSRPTRNARVLALDVFWCRVGPLWHESSTLGTSPGTRPRRV